MKEFIKKYWTIKFGYDMVPRNAQIVVKKKCQ